MSKNYYINYSNYYPDADECDADVNTAEIDNVCRTLEQALDYHWEQINDMLDGDVLGDDPTVRRERITLYWNANTREMTTHVKGLKYTFYIKKITEAEA